jgi:fibronectin type 3 domain-containing protein
MKKLSILVVVLLSYVLLAFGQTSPCGPHTPTPGVAHVCIAWIAPTTGPVVSSYNVYRATTAGGESYTSPALGNTTSTFYYDATVVDGTTYYYTVLSVGSGGALSSPSSEVSSLPVSPSNPTSPSASSVP